MRARPAERAPRRDGEARLHLAVAALALGAALAARAPVTSLILAGAALAHGAASGARWRSVAAMLAPAAAMGAVAAAVRLLLARGQPAATVDLLGLRFALPRAAAHDGVTALARILAAGAVASWLRARLSFRGALAGLAWFGLPPALLELVALTRRFQGVLRRRGEQLRAAQAARLGYAGHRRSLASAGRWLGRLSCRALDQAAATGDALRARGDRGVLPLPRPTRPRREDLGVAIGAACCLALALAAARGSAW